MATKKPTTPTKKRATKAVTTKKPVAKKKATASKKTVRTSTTASTKVDYYPNRVSLLTALAAASILLLLALITVPTP
jgi:hypothetical protein